MTILFIFLFKRTKQNYALYIFDVSAQNNNVHDDMHMGQICVFYTLY